MKKYFRENRVSFKEINVEHGLLVALDIQRKTGQAGVPVIKIGSRWIVGFDRPAIERELSRRS